MSLDFAHVKGISVGGNTVKNVALNGIDIWSKESGGSEPPILLSWEHVLWSIEQGSYADDYSIGDLIPLDLGTEGQLNAQVADFNHDDLSDGNGKAHISFITKELCLTASGMNLTDTNVGGWKDSLMRNTTMPSIWEKLPAILRESIAEVVKKTSAGNKDTTIVSTNDKLWIPSLFEVDSSRTDSVYFYEGTTYPIFTDASSRIKARNGSASKWWLRSPNKDNSRLFGVEYDGIPGSGTSYRASNKHGVAVGFCI